MNARDTRIPVRLPASLVNSPEFGDLNIVQRQNFESRIRYISEICEKAFLWIERREGFQSTAHLIDHLELDILVNLSIGDEVRSISPWMVHTSWTARVPPQAMVPHLPTCVLAWCCAKPASVNCDEGVFLEWLGRGVRCLDTVLEKFSQSENFDGVVGCLVAIDVSLSCMLGGITLQRLNGSIAND